MSNIQAASVQVPLYHRNGAVRCYMTIDAADEAWVTQWHWFGLLANRGHRYAARRGPKMNGKYTTILLHRELLGLPRVWDGLDGDHINRNRLDNRRSNLRAVPHAINVQNTPGCGGRSRYRGVAWHNSHRKWSARAIVAGKNTWLGYFTSELDAAQTVARWRAEHMPGAVEDIELLGSA